MTTAGPVGTDRPFSHRFSVVNVTPTNRPNPVWLRRQASLIDLISEGDIGPSSPLTIGRLAVLGDHILVDRIEVHDDPVGAVGPEAVQAFQRRQDGVHGAGSPVELPEAFLQVLPGVRFRERREIVRRPVLLAFAHLSAPYLQPLSPRSIFRTAQAARTTASTVAAIMAATTHAPGGKGSSPASWARGSRAVSRLGAGSCVRRPGLPSPSGLLSASRRCARSRPPGGRPRPAQGGRGYRGRRTSRLPAGRRRPFSRPPARRARRGVRPGSCRCARTRLPDPPPTSRPAS